jgi:hypothetical protein
MAAGIEAFSLMAELSSYNLSVVLWLRLRSASMVNLHCVWFRLPQSPALQHHQERGGVFPPLLCGLPPGAPIVHLNVVRKLGYEHS